MNLQLTRLAVLVLAWAAGCASMESYPNARRADRLFDEIADCARKDPSVPFLTKCRKEFEEVEFSAKVESVKTLGVNYITLFAEMGDPNQLVNCSIKGGRFRERIDKLKNGDVVRLKGTPARVSFGEVSFAHFEECELAE